MNAEAPILSRLGLRRWIAEVLDCSPELIGDEDSLIELGMSSLMMMRLPVMLKKAGVSVKLADMLKDATLGSWVRLVEQGRRCSVEQEPECIVDGQPFALTDMQRAYWLGRQTVFPLGGIAAHGYLEIHEPKGKFDLPRLEKALNQTILAHPMLRTVLTPDGQQKVLPEVPWYRIHSRCGTHATAECREEMRAEVLPAETWPLFNICVSGTDNAPCAYLHISFDILLLDVASLALWLNELHGLYTGQQKKACISNRQFSQYVAQAEASKELASAKRHREWWQARAAQLPRAPQLPFAHQPRELTPPVIGRLASHMQADAWQSLKSHAARAGVTAAGMFAAILGETLSRFSRSPHMTLNLTLFDRAGERAAYDGVLGDFTSMLPVTVRAGAGQTFLALCRAAHEDICQALSHADISGAEVNAIIARAHATPNENPLPVVLTCATGIAGGSYLDAASRFGELIFACNQAPQTWIDAQVVEYRDGLSLVWDYPQGLFPPDLVESMFEQFVALAHALSDGGVWGMSAQTVRQPRIQPASLALLPPARQSLAGPFLKRAAFSPAATALITPEKTLSYGELDRLSGDLARRLTSELLVNKGELVGIALPKGWLQVVAVLAVLRAGAAYLPVNVSDPQSRILTILAEGGVRLALCDGKNQGFLADADCQLAEISVESTPLLLADFSGNDTGSTRATGAGKKQSSGQTVAVDASVDVDPEATAYVIFTSGSTGKPKGVAVSHQSALNTILDVNSRNAVGPNDRVFGISQLNFDLSVYDIFGTLAAGAALVLPQHAEFAEPLEWVKQVEHTQVTVWNSVPALAQLLLDSAKATGGCLKHLRLFMLSGDWLPVELAASILALPQEPRLVSMGGATEAAIWSVEKVVDALLPGQKTVPYGKPLSGQMLYVLDASMRPCPLWVPGEIYIAGVGLAQEYLHRPELTEQSFFSHPQTGERLYRTGDWGRMLPDGDIEFMGRDDTQVKINGMRIELGEIESAIAEMPGVRQAVAVVAEHSQSRKIVAFAQPDGDHKLDAQRIGLALKGRLPYSWLPAEICLESTFPLTANGKVDRRALTARAKASLSKPRAREASVPETKAQQQIADVWASVLNGARPGVSVSFFDAGGTSFLAMQLSTRLTAVLQRPVPVLSVFQYTTIASQAKHLIDAEVLCSTEAGHTQGRVEKLRAMASRVRPRR